MNHKVNIRYAAHKRVETHRLRSLKDLMWMRRLTPLSPSFFHLCYVVCYDWEQAPFKVLSESLIFICSWCVCVSVFVWRQRAQVCVHMCLVEDRAQPQMAALFFLQWAPASALKHGSQDCATAGAGTQFLVCLARAFLTGSANPQVLLLQLLVLLGWLHSTVGWDLKKQKQNL